MFEKLDVIRMAKAMNAHAGARQSLVARNVANADTPGYRARDVVVFSDTYSQDDGMRATRSKHRGANTLSAAPGVVASGGSGSPNGNDVSIEMETVKSASARQDHEMALAIYRAASGVVRASLGRNG